MVASTRAAPRLAKKLGAPPKPLYVLAGCLPAGISLLEPPGVASGEVWLEVA